MASAEDIDEVVKWSLGIRLALSGPLEQRDMNGIDVHHAIASYLYQDLENRQEPSELLRGKVERGELGAKSGQGFCLEPRTPRTRAARRARRWPNWPPGWSARLAAADGRRATPNTQT